MLLSFAASAEDPISGGRHKVIGSKPLFIPPQTSTIASHLPKAVGAAFSIGIARTLKLEDTPLPGDAIVLASFGDASANHSTAQGAFNTAAWAAYQGTPDAARLPVRGQWHRHLDPDPARLDRGLVPEPARASTMSIAAASTWSTPIAARARRPGSPGPGAGPSSSTWTASGSTAMPARTSRRPISARRRSRRTRSAIPCSTAPPCWSSRGCCPASDILDIYNETEATLARIAEQAITRPKLTTSRDGDGEHRPAEARRRRGPTRRRPEQREALFARDRSMMDKPQHMARLLSWALADLMLAHPEIIVAGEDVGPKGGVYNVTAKLHERFGPARVINTLLDEQSILGLGIGAAHNGLLPITEIQFLAYVHNAEDQLRGEAATLSFFSDGQYTNPMIVRIAGLGYQKGFGGHFHNDNSLAIFRDIPGLILACPSNGADAVEMLRECVRLALEEQRVIVFVEPIALYMTRDLHEEGDGLWTATYAAPGEAKPIRLGELGVHGDGTDLAIVSYANGYYLSRQAEKILSEQHGLKLRVIDLRWLAPLNEDGLIDAVAGLRAHPDRRRMPQDRLAERGADGAVRRARAGRRAAAGSPPRTASSRSAGRRP